MASVAVTIFVIFARHVLGTGLGQCPAKEQIPDFDMQKMTGVWYEVERSFYVAEVAASCTEIHVDVNDRGYFLIRVNTVNRWTSNPSTTHGIGVPNHNGSSAFRYRLNTRMPYALGRLLPGAGYYTILFTDYSQYAVVWSCTSLTVAYSDRMWILGRQRELAAAVRAYIYSELAKRDLDPDRLILSRNINCTDAIFKKYNNTDGAFEASNDSFVPIDSTTMR